jgi:hypothetical protein
MLSVFNQALLIWKTHFFTIPTLATPAKAVSIDQTCARAAAA